MATTLPRPPRPAFGIFDYSMIGKIDRLLKPFGLHLRVVSNRRKWGDAVEVSVVRIEETEK
jgi:hypothetical protein